MDNLALLRWRESRALALEDQALAEAFSSRAAEIHAQVTFLLSQGFSEGANESLAAMAEGDMVEPERAVALRVRHLVSAIELNLGVADVVMGGGVIHAALNGAMAGRLGWQRDGQEQTE